MALNYGLKPLDDKSVVLIEEFYRKLIAQRKFCHFCKGGNTCRCGQCPEVEYHDVDCIVGLLDRIIHNYYRHEENKSPNLTLTTVEELTWYRERIKELETKLGIGDDW